MPQRQLTPEQERMYSSEKEVSLYSVLLHSDQVFSLHNVVICLLGELPMAAQDCSYAVALRIISQGRNIRANNPRALRHWPILRGRSWVNRPVTGVAFPSTTP